MFESSVVKKHVFYISGRDSDSQLIQIIAAIIRGTISLCQLANVRRLASLIKTCYI